MYPPVLPPALRSPCWCCCTAVAAARDFDFMFPIAEEYGVALLTLDARHNTWDGIDSPFGPDIRFIDAALRYTFQRVPSIRRASPWAAYRTAACTRCQSARSMATCSHIWLPSHQATSSAGAAGRQAAYLSRPWHSRQRYSLTGSRMRLLPQLRQAGYDVTYYEFDGPHFMTPPAARAALKWLVD